MYHDNLFCTYPDQTVEFVNHAKIPVMGFKVLAAGAIHPKDGFIWAFENGADFICVGMFDFQVVEDVNICLDALQNLQNRKRAWFA
jgi:NAD(P)H-dependent flavin oxidoreductase YrpB (nitropropane dioxygenase family)